MTPNAADTDYTYSPTGVLGEEDQEISQQLLTSEHPAKRGITFADTITADATATAIAAAAEQKTPAKVNGVSKKAESDPNAPAEIKIVWLNLILMTYFHLAGFHGLYLLLTNKIMWQTILLHCSWSGSQ